MTEVGQTESVANGGRMMGHMKMEEREVEEEERRGEEERKKERKRKEERRGERVTEKGERTRRLTE